LVLFSPFIKKREKSIPEITKGREPEESSREGEKELTRGERASIKFDALCGFMHLKKAAPPSRCGP